MLRKHGAHAGSGRFFVAIGLVALVGYIVATSGLRGSDAYDVWAALLLAPLLILVSLPFLARQARRQEDPRVFRLLFLALLLKLGFSLVRYYVDFTVYKGEVDASGYFGAGAKYAVAFRHGIFDLSTHLIGSSGSLVGTNFVRVATGVVLAFIGPTKLGGFLVFSWLGFVGLFFFYRAFVLAVPEGNARAYAIPLFLLPTLLFWPSEMGKEALMVLALGVGAFGAAQLLTDRTMRGMAGLGSGLLLAAMIRPPLAGLLAVAAAAAFLMKKPKRSLRELGPMVKAVAAAVVILLALLMVRSAHRFLVDSGVDVSGGLDSAFAQAGVRTSGGGSAFTPTALTSPRHIPIAILTVVFRPLLIDVHGGLAAFSALEGTVMLFYAFWRIPWGWAALTSARRQPFVALAIVYTLLFVVAFSGFTNFGYLVRERSQLYPLFLVLLSVPPVGHRRAGHGRPPAEVAHELGRPDTKPLRALR
jgi:hypothetical protein